MPPVILLPIRAPCRPTLLTNVHKFPGSIRVQKPSNRNIRTLLQVIPPNIIAHFVFVFNRILYNCNPSLSFSLVRFQYRLQMLFLFVICFLVEPSQSIGDDKRFTALKFGTTMNDYVQFSNFDMSPFRNALTMCAWMRRVYTGLSYSEVVMHFHTRFEYWEILITPTGHYNQFVGSSVVNNIQSKFTTPVGKWLHYCVSFTTSTHTIQVYLNGVQVASGQTRSRRQLYTSGT